MKNQNVYTIVLAGGNGTRMASNLPKVLHSVGGLSLLNHVLRLAFKVNSQEVAVVVSPAIEQFLPTPADKVSYIQQKSPRGTGHAVQQCIPWLGDKSGIVLILCGDAPFISAASVTQLLQEKEKKKCGLAIMAMRPKDAKRYGRVFLDEDGYVERITEFKDLEGNDKENTLSNAGIMVADTDTLISLLDKLSPQNANKEYYLTDVVALGRAEGYKTAVTEAPEEELLGVNNQQDLAAAEQVFQEHMRQDCLERGVRLMAPNTVFFSYDTHLKEGVTVEPYVVFGPHVTVENGVRIGSFSHIEGAHIRKGAMVGPFARVRGKSVIGQQAKVGNFVEIKNATLDEGAKANHLSYLGDCKIGKQSNIGAGTITCNYDGQHKHRTTIEENVFVGSNTALVAPVTVGRQAIIGAGSVITKDVPPQDLAIARAPQVNITKGGEKVRTKHSCKKG